MTRNPYTAAFGRLWRASPPLTALALLMLGAAAGAAAGLLVDPRLVTGAPAWLKPFKFAVSIAVYSVTLAWIFSRLTGWGRMRRIVGWTSLVVFVIEMGIIALQAGRGVGSHFNTATLLDGALFTAMGAAIVIQTLASVGVAVALWRHEFADRALGWALRLGMTLTIVGAFTGGLMTRPTAAQLADARAGRGMPVAGAHTVGATDGGPGLPLTGWSTRHGDLRVPHFVGLHAIQVLSLVGLALRRRVRSEAVRVRAVWIAAASYASLFVVLLWGALRGQSVADPDTAALAALTTWAVATLVALAWARCGSRAPARHLEEVAA